MLTYAQQAARFRARAATHEQESLMLADQAAANSETWPAFSRDCRTKAGKLMRLALECYDSAARAEYRATLCPSDSRVHYPVAA